MVGTTLVHTNLEIIQSLLRFSEGLAGMDRCAEKHITPDGYYCFCLVKDPENAICEVWLSTGY